MAKKTPKSFYAVRAGRKVGIYTTWDDCKHQVDGHCGAIFKGFGTLAEAQKYMNEDHASMRSWPVVQEIESGFEPEPKLMAPSATPTPTINGLRLAVVNDESRPTINGPRASQAKPTPGLEVGSHHRDGVLKKATTKVEQPECYFEKFSKQKQKFKPDVKAEFNQEFDRLASSQGWVPGSQKYKTERVTALSSQVRTHFFQDALVEGDTEGLSASEEFSDPANYISSFRDQTPLRKLRGFQAICRAVAREPGGTLEQCKMILKGTLVNIIDLIDASRTGKSLEVWTDFRKFEHYTRSDRAKTIPLDEAKGHEVLSCFLQAFNPKGHKMYKALCAQLRASRVGLPLNQAMRSSNNSRRANIDFSENEDANSRSPTSSPLARPCPAPKIEAFEGTRVKADSSSSRGRAVVVQQITECAVTIKRKRSESPVFLFERPCKKKAVAATLGEDIQSSLKEWSEFNLTQEPD